MPELPEVETVVKGLAPMIEGQVVREVEVLLPKTVWLDEVRATGQSDVDRFIALVEGKNIQSISRRAKMILITFSDNVTVLVHLKMTGQLIFVDDQARRVAGGHPTAEMAGELPSKSTRVIFRFDTGVLYFNDQRQFGYIKVVPSSGLATSQPYASYGPEPLSEGFSAEYLAMRARARPAVTIKQLLLDQTVIAGIGNIYADESLFMAKVRPDRAAKSLTDGEFLLLWQSIKEVLTVGIAYGGTSSEHFVQADGSKGTMQDHLKVYRRAGQICQRCGGMIERTVIGGRGTHFCAGCQR